MRQSFFSIITIIIFSVALAACGGGGGGGSTGSAKAPSKKSSDTNTGGTDFVIGNPQTAPTPQEGSNDAQKVTDNGALDGLAIFRDGNAVAPITGPKLTITLDGNNIDEILTFVNARYEATENGETTDKVNIFTGTDITGDVTTTLNVNKGSDFFGFQSQEMTHLSWSNNTIDGMMIAGTETTTLSDLGGVTTFTGRGKGVYGDADGTHATIFTVNATINSTDTTVTFKSTDTCKGTQICTVSDTANWLPALNLTTGALSYTSNEISGAVTSAGLTGTLDARFYGNTNGKEELGGIFALTGTSSYYIGAFGAERNAVVPDPVFMASSATTVNALGTVAVVSTQATAIPTYLDGGVAVGYASLTDISAAAMTANASKTATLQGLTVLFNDFSELERDTGVTDWNTVKLNQQLTPTSITASATDLAASSAVDLTFNADGTVAATKTYADAEYMTGLTYDDTTIFGFADADNDPIAADSMAYISWSLAGDVVVDGSDATMGTDTDKTLMMIVGIETANIFIPSAGKIDFTGKGEGVYGSVDANKALTSDSMVFDMVVAVDFTSDSVSFTTSNTQCKATCNHANTPNLNFSTGAFSYSGNSISKTDLTVGAGLAGRLDARFYGSDSQEIGGTFALAQASADAINGSYYYGAFGATRNGVAPFVASDTTTINALGQKTVISTNATDVGSYTSLTDVSNAANGGTAIEVILQGTAFALSEVTNYERYKTTDNWTNVNNLITDSQITASRIVASAEDPTDLTSTSSVKLTFGTDGNISNVIAYTDAEYETGGTGLTISATRNVETFGFNSNFMALISWNLQGSVVEDVNDAKFGESTDREGIMLAGIETNDFTGISTTQAVNFSGKGRGTYSDADASYNTIFDVTAAVNFVDNNVTISSSKTCKDAVSAVCTDGGADRVDFLNVNTAALSFHDGTDYDNNISGAVTSSTLAGTLDARFYGALANNAPREFGGSFALIGANSYYYGGFGTERGGVVSGSYALAASIGDGTAGDGTNGYVVTTQKSEVIAQDVNNMAYASLTLAADDSAVISKAFTLKGLSAYDRKNDTTYTFIAGKTWGTSDITINETHIGNIIGSSADITFDGSGNVTAVSVLTAEFDATDNVDMAKDVTYTANSNFSHSADKRVATAAISGISGASSAITVDRSATTFGFNTDYMTLVSWDLDRTVSGFPASASAGDTDSTYSIDGMMLAGIEAADVTTLATVFTNANNDPMVDVKLNFSGKGKGVYGDENISYNTVFNVTAEVNLTEKTIDINSSRTCKAVVNADCRTGGLSRVDFLDFSVVAVGYADTDTSVKDTAISANVTTIDADNSLAGTLDARFYGESLEEFGGSFALADITNNQHYYGAFGASSLEHNSAFEQQVASHPNLPNAPVTPYNDFTDAYTAEDNGTTNIDYTLPIVIAVEQHIVQEHMRDIAAQQASVAFPNGYERFDNSTVVNETIAQNQYAGGYINFEVDASSGLNNVIIDDGLLNPTLYVGNQEYVGATNHSRNAEKASGNNIVGYGIGLNQTSTELRLRNNIDGFGNTVNESNSNKGFEPKYMMAIFWRLHRGAQNNLVAVNNYDITNVVNETTYIRYGYGLAGIETAGNDIPTVGSATFHGGGRGSIVTYQEISVTNYEHPDYTHGAQSPDHGNYDKIHDEKDFYVTQNVTFSIKADVHFGNRTVKFTGDNVEYNSAGNNNNTEAHPEWHFETPTIRYRAGDNNLNGDVATIDYTDDMMNTANINARGSINARFYGAGAAEIGGTIVMETPDQTRSFIGVFGACRRASQSVACE